MSTLHRTYRPEANSAAKIGGDSFVWGTERIQPQSRGLKATVDSDEGSMDTEKM